VFRPNLKARGLKYASKWINRSVNLKIIVRDWNRLIFAFRIRFILVMPSSVYMDSGYM
jgi:hypothetical protein